ncbi:myc-associated zinc finger protein [Anabrus simplex]|uniref:myc-associated zinc finger protein n=1 Tax=Anabrus simplex TaxID=316456 RepID=UPI0035A3D375
MEFAGPIKTEPLEDTDDDVIIIEDDMKPDISSLQFKVKQEPTIDLVPKIKVEPSDPELHQAKRVQKTPLHVVILNKNHGSEKCAVDNVAAKKAVMIITTRAPNLQINSKQLSCSTCSETFRHEYFLMTHNLVHRRWEYQCMPCKVRFDRKEMFRLHLCTHSSGIRVYCPLCKRDFESGFCLMAHSCLENVYPCPVCRAACSSYSAVMRHVACHVSAFR